MQINNAKFFLTYPKCTLTPEALLAKLPFLENLREYVISQEKHADGSDHIHCVLHYSERIRTRDVRFFDIEGYHPNIKTLKTKADLHRTARYAVKDGHFITEGDMLKKSRDEIFQALVNIGEVTADFIQANPSVLALNFSSIKGWLQLLGRTSLLSKRVPKEKRRHIYLYGPSNTGKSTWLYAKLSHFKYQALIPTNNDWFQCTQETEVLYFDEYKGHLSIQQLNSLCDGCTTLNTKGSSTSILQPLVILVSNLSPEDNYINLSSNLMETFHNRFIVYKSDVLLPDL